MSAPTIPDHYYLDFPSGISANVGVAGGVAVTLLGDPQHPIAAQVGMELVGDPQRPIAAQVGVELVGDSQRPIAAKADLSMLLANLPVFSRDDIFEMLRRRIRMPVNLRFGMSVFPFNLFDVDVVQFSLCGEPQVIVDDYVPNAYERCAIECEPYEDCDG
jgi:hypothetical protein